MSKGPALSYSAFPKDGGKLPDYAEHPMMATLDDAAPRFVQAMAQQPQAQYSLLDQLYVLRAAANKLGLYDAADYLRDSVLPKRDDATGNWERAHLFHG